MSKMLLYTVTGK